MIHFDEEKQNIKIKELKSKNAEEFAKNIASKNDLPYINLNIISINIGALKYISEKDSRDGRLAAFDVLGKKMKIAVFSPENPETKKIIEKLKEKDFEVSIYVASDKSLEKVWERYSELSGSTESEEGVVEISQEKIKEIIENELSVEEIKKMIEELLSEKKGYKISKALEIMLGGGITTKASDIHMEPEDDYVRMRYRLDGVLTNIINIPHKIYNPIISRIKLVSGLKINKPGIAQDGRFSIKLGEDEIEIRVSIIPGAYGETVVMRILNPNAIAVTLENLGMNERLLGTVEKEIKRPNGMILTTGPTGSGKTTTLYAFLKKIHRPGIKIITIENPIEYHLPGIVQTQVDKKENYTFSTGLRSALRQDPDIIMVGEIRDKETAETAVHAALTGHLVFSTLHTNNAAGTFARLIDMGIDAKIIPSALNLSMAQRLVRKLCQKCKVERNSTDEEKKKMENIIETIGDKSYVEGLDVNKIWTAPGCGECHNTGYKGRIGIYEAILTDENIENLIKENPSEREVVKVVKNQNILDMRQDGVVKILKGITSIEELERVIDLTIR